MSTVRDDERTRKSRIMRVFFSLSLVSQIYDFEVGQTAISGLIMPLKKLGQMGGRRLLSA
jgi:hypothetical protein